MAIEAGVHYAEVVCDDDDTAGDPEQASPLGRPPEQLLDCLWGRGCSSPGVNVVVATGAYTLLAVVVVVPDASPGRSCTCCGCAAAAATAAAAAAAAAAAYSGGGTQMPPTTTNCGAVDGVTLVPPLWTAAVEFGRLVCKRYF